MNPFFRGCGHKINCVVNFFFASSEIFFGMILTIPTKMGVIRQSKNVGSVEVDRVNYRADTKQFTNRQCKKLTSCQFLGDEKNKATVTRCDLSARFFCIEATLLCEFERDKI